MSTLLQTFWQLMSPESSYETAEALYAHGVIDEESMREFDASCLDSVYTRFML